MTVFKAENPIIYSTPGDVFEAFKDIIEAFGCKPFENITFDIENGRLEYDCYGKHIIKLFDMEQAEPEQATDVIQWLFSMLDTIANL